MKILLLVLQMSLGILTYPEELCEIKESIYYDIVDTVVQIPIFYCFFNVRDDFKCENYNHSETILNPLVVNNCNNKRHSKLHPHSAVRLDINSEQGRVAVCESKAQASLLKNIIILPDNKLCDYSKGFYEYHINCYIIWIPDTCLKLLYVYNGPFDVYTAKTKKLMYIRQEHRSLQIMEQFFICNLNMWKTNYDGILVILSYNKNITQYLTLPIYQSTLNQACRVTKKNDTIKLTKSWYIYSYVIDVKVYRCFFGGNGSCATLKLEEYSANESFLNVCKTFCKTCTDVKVCGQTLKVDLKQDIVQGTSNCKYSDGECRSISAFWSNSDSCGDIKQFEGTYKGDCNDTNCVIRNFNFTELILSVEGDLCGENVWFTNRDGIVASETELQFITKVQVHSTEKMYFQRENLETHAFDHKSFVNYLLLFVVICILWYIFNVVVNLFSLMTVGKTRASKNRAYLLNCVSQSLTNRYIFLHSESASSEPIIMSGLQESEMYESIDDKL